MKFNENLQLKWKIFLLKIKPWNLDKEKISNLNSLGNTLSSQLTQFNFILDDHDVIKFLTHSLTPPLSDEVYFILL